MTCTKAQWKFLDKNFGHEIAVLLLNKPMTCPEIREKIPYNVRKDQIRCKLHEGNELDVFSLVGVPGTDTYQFEESEFNETQIGEINRRALARITSPAAEWEPVSTLDELPDEFFYKYERDEVRKKEIVPYIVVFENKGEDMDYNYKVEHANIARKESDFINGITEPWDIE
jgi:hypothetical protein